MPINFGTVNLNQRLYRKIMWYVLAELYSYDYKRIAQFWRVWDVEIINTEETDLDYFKHVRTTSGQKIVKGIPSGHTGIEYIGLFLIDKNDWATHRTNADVMQHELCHAVVLKELNFDTSSGEHVTWVHNESKRFYKSFWYWSWRNWLKLRFRISIIDIREHLTSNL